MKRIILSLTIIFISFFVDAQTPYSLNIGIGPPLNFDNPSTHPYFYIDTLQINNIWQIGRPNKLLFDSAYSFPNGIVTDTINNYPINNYSSFFMTLLKAEGLMFFTFRHKYNTDASIDGCNIEISFDYGSTWGNVIDNSYLNLWDSECSGTYNFYSSQDTIKSLGNQPGFSGNSSDWISSTFEIYYQNSNIVPDTFLLRFNFGSDSLNSGKAGWLIDDIFMGASHIGIKDNSTTNIKFLPNPTDGILTIGNFEGKVNSIRIFNNIGQNILEFKKTEKKEIDLSLLNNGIYYITINTDKGMIKQKIIVQK